MGSFSFPQASPSHRWGVEWTAYTDMYACLEERLREVQQHYEYHLRKEGVEDTIYSLISTLHTHYAFPRDLMTEGIYPSSPFHHPEGRRFYNDSLRRLKTAAQIAYATVRSVSFSHYERGESLSLLEARIIETGMIIHPSQRVNPFSRYRNVLVSPGLGDIPFTLPEDIPYEMNRFLNDLFEIPHNFLRGIYTHFHLVRIHPFVDGNGRLARVWQNAFFKKERFPPFTIFPLKEEVYAAAGGYLNHTTVKQIREEYRHLMASTRREYERGNPYYLMPLVSFTVKRVEELISLFKGSPRDILVFLKKHTSLRK